MFFLHASHFLCAELENDFVEITQEAVTPLPVPSPLLLINKLKIIIIWSCSPLFALLSVSCNLDCDFNLISNLKCFHGGCVSFLLTGTLFHLLHDLEWQKRAKSSQLQYKKQLHELCAHSISMMTCSPNIKSINDI